MKYLYAIQHFKNKKYPLLVKKKHIQTQNKLILSFTIFSNYRNRLRVNIRVYI